MEHIARRERPSLRATDSPTHSTDVLRRGFYSRAAPVEVAGNRLGASSASDIYAAIIQKTTLYDSERLGRGAQDLATPHALLSPPLTRGPSLLLAPHHPRPSLRLSLFSTLWPAKDSTKHRKHLTAREAPARIILPAPIMPIPRSRPFVPRSPSTPRVPALQTSAEELGTYSEGELLDDPEAFETALSSIEPLSDKSLKAIANLARYKPPPDPCKHSDVSSTGAEDLMIASIHCRSVSGGTIRRARRSVRFALRREPQRPPLDAQSHTPNICEHVLVL